MTNTIIPLVLIMAGCSSPGTNGSDDTAHYRTDSVTASQTVKVVHEQPETLIIDSPASLSATSIPSDSPIGNELPIPASSFDHALWESLLQAHVSKDGLVDYPAFKKDKRFESYLQALRNAKPSSAWSVYERKAFWINVYNAFTIKLIVNHPGVKTINDIPAPWKTEFFSIGGTKMDLDRVEHIELREKLKDPRIHFGIVCASFSCPQLWNHAYTATGMDKQLDDAAGRFINDPLRNRISGSDIALSKIFEWFKGDFTEGQTLIAFINRYAAMAIPANAKVSYLDYDWRLNGK